MSRDRYAVVTAGGKRHVARWHEDRCCPRHDAEGRWIPLCWQRAREWQETDGFADCSRCIREVNTNYMHTELAIGRGERGGVMQTRPVLTVRQREVLAFIESYMAEHGWPPTIREIGEGIGLTSPSTVHAHMQTLHRKGYIEISKSGARQGARQLRVVN